jgi:tRNA nucleotidyltransferase (CCA-adding enzyme)
MLRAARYAARLRFRLAPETEAAIRRDLPYVDFVTGARLRTELRLTFLEPTAVDATELARDLGVLEAIDPHLGLDSAVANRWREALAGERLADVVELGFCLVCICNETADVASISRRLHLTGTLEAALHDLVHARAAFAKLASSDAGPAAVAEALDGLRPASVWAAGLRAGGWARRTAEAYLARWRRARPLLRGSDLLALGVAEGPDVGQLLRRLRASRLEGRIRTREDEIRFVESLLKSGREA